MSYKFHKLTRGGVLSQDSKDPRKKRLTLMGGRKLLYDATGDGVEDNPIDVSPRRVNTAVFDGWGVYGLPYTYLVGKPLSGEFSGLDGVTTFLGEGVKPLSFYLERLAWFDWADKQFQPIGPVANYDRKNISTKKSSVTLDGVTIGTDTTVNWADVWTSQGGGSVSVRWNIDAQRVKEEIVIDQASRASLLLTAPKAPPASLYLSAIFRVSGGSGFKVKKGSSEERLDSSLDKDDADGSGLSFTDAAGSTIARLPVSDAWIADAEGPIPDTQRPLSKRFFQRDGVTYLALGLPLSELLKMPLGDLVLDPTVQDPGAASSDDAHEEQDGDVVLTATNIGLRNNASFHKQYAGFRWDGVGIAAGSTVDEAELRLYHHTNGDTIDCSIDLEDADDPSTFTTTDNDISSRTLTGNSVSWSGTTSSGYESSPSIATATQAVIDRPGWAEDNAMVAVVEAASGTTGEHRIRTFDNSPDYAAVLYIEFTDPGAATVENTYQIDASDRDGDCNNSGGGHNITRGNIDLQEFGQRHLALIFSGVDIAQGTDIDSAYLHLYCESGSTRNNIDTDFYGEDVDDSPDLTITDNDITDRTKTTASVNWTEASMSLGFHQSPDFSAIVQEILDRPGWAEDNALGIIGSWVADRLRFETYDDSIVNCAKLVITYTPSASDYLPRGLSSIRSGVISSGGSGLHTIESGII